jgi:hypothetical protein
MSGGESDAIKYIPVDTRNTPAPVEYKSADLKNTSTTSNSFQFTGSTSAVYPPWYWYGSTTVYKYQIKCPIKTCKRINWLELDKITPCFECGCKLKAVSQIADYEIEINI